MVVVVVEDIAPGSVDSLGVQTELDYWCSVAEADLHPVVFDVELVHFWMLIAFGERWMLLLLLFQVGDHPASAEG